MHVVNQNITQVFYDPVSRIFIILALLARICFIINQKDNYQIRHEEIYYKTMKNTGQKLMSFM